MPAGKVTRSGEQFLLNGSPYRAIGFNMWPMAISSNFGHPPNYDGRNVSQLAGVLSDIRTTAPHVNTLRIWFLQQFTLNGGNRDWSGFDACLAAADAAGFKVVASLEDNWAYERTGSQNPALSSSWWNGGYSNTVLTTQKEPYRQWVSEVVTRYSGDERVLSWELVNEGNGMTLGFVQDVAGLVRSLDSTTLISLGEAGADAASFYSVAAVDYASYHYYTDYGQTGWTSSQQAAANAGKPFVMGEMGNSGSGTSRSNTVNTLLTNVFADSNSAGFYYWQYAETGGDQFKVTSASDPLLPVLDSYVLASGPPPPLPAPATTNQNAEECVSWSAVNGASAYHAQLLDTNGNVLRDRPTIAATQWTWTPLTDGTTYQWHVAAVDSGGNTGTYTALQSFTAGG